MPKDRIIHSNIDRNNMKEIWFVKSIYRYMHMVSVVMNFGSTQLKDSGVAPVLFIFYSNN